MTAGIPQVSLGMPNPAVLGNAPESAATGISKLLLNAAATNREQARIQREQAIQDEVLARTRRDDAQKQAANQYAKDIMNVAKAGTITEKDATDINLIADRIAQLDKEGDKAGVAHLQGIMQREADAASERAKYSTAGVKEMVGNLLNGRDVDVATALTLQNAALSPLEVAAKEAKIERSTNETGKLASKMVGAKNVSELKDIMKEAESNPYADKGMLTKLGLDIAQHQEKIGIDKEGLSVKWAALNAEKDVAKNKIPAGYVMVGTNPDGTPKLMLEFMAKMEAERKELTPEDIQKKKAEAKKATLEAQKLEKELAPGWLSRTFGSGN